MARGHRIDTVAEVPLVVANDIESVGKTKDAVKVQYQELCLVAIDNCCRC